DDPVARTIETRLLKQWNFEVTSAADGLEAWNYLQRVEGPALAILDWIMPGLSGPEVCRRLRDERPLASVYVVMLTSCENPRDAIAGLDAGADDYVLKPFDRDQLRARVDVGVRVLSLQEG